MGGCVTVMMRVVCTVMICVHRRMHTLMLYDRCFIGRIRTLVAVKHDPNPNRLLGGALRLSMACTHCSRVPWGTALAALGLSPTLSRFSPVVP